MEKKCNQVGVINANGYESENRVYRGGCCPAIKIGGDPKKVVKKWVNSQKAKPLTIRGGCCRTIKAQVQQTSAANYVRSGSFGATGVIRKWKGGYGRRKDY